MIEEAIEIGSAQTAAPEDAYAISIEGMRKAYGRTLAVEDLSMHVPRGSIYGFVGPNGAGKSTTIRTLATLQSADEGLVCVEGIDVHADPGAVRDRVGYMPDFFGVYESLSVWEYLNFYAASHRVPAARRRQTCEELLELVDLVHRRRDSVETLSRGMKQRLGLARCLIHDPTVLLLDEPASGMDPRARLELREIMRELSGLKKTILVSSHILPELSEMCTHIGVISGGTLLAEGPVAEVVARLGAASHLRVRTLDHDSAVRASNFLDAHPLSGSVEAQSDGSLLGTFSGAEADLASMLTQMISIGIPVTGFVLEGGTLEDIFLHITEEDDA